MEDTNPASGVIAAPTGSVASPAATPDTTASTAAPASVAQPTPVPDSTQPGPVSYDRFKEVNEKAKELAEWRKQRAWAEQIDPTVGQQLQSWHQAYQTDPARWFSGVVADLRQSHPHLVPSFHSEAARILAGARGGQPEPEIEPDIPVVDEHGRVVSQSYSAERVKQLITRAVSEALGKEVGPIKQTIADAKSRAEKRHRMEAMEADITEAKSIYPFFDEQEEAIAQALKEHPNWTLDRACGYVWHTVVSPKADQKSQAKVLSDLQQKATAGTVNPGAQNVGGKPKFKNFTEAAKYYDAHPDEAEAAAQRSL